MYLLKILYYIIKLYDMQTRKDTAIFLSCTVVRISIL